LFFQKFPFTLDFSSKADQTLKTNHTTCSSIMKKSSAAFLTVGAVLCGVQASQATTIADWTFETSQPSGSGSIGPITPEIGSGSAYASGLFIISSPAGNGSSHSLSANGWTNGVPMYYQFDVNTVGYSDIGVTFDQASSSTGPANFLFQYSTDGSTFTTLQGYSPLLNGSPNPPWNSTTSSSLYTFNFDLSSITALNNASTVDFRLLETGSAAENGGTIGQNGTDRVDNFIVATVPEPSTYTLGAIAGIAGWFGMRRKR
jgi:hypothetical protein